MSKVIDKITNEISSYCKLSGKERNRREMRFLLDVLLTKQTQEQIDALEAIRNEMHKGA